MVVIVVALVVVVGVVAVLVVGLKTRRDDSIYTI
jgi:hypothetical protein